MTTDVVATDLLVQIRRKRAEVDAVIGRTLPRKRLLLNVSIVAGGLAAVLTTGPAVGGQSFVAWVKTAFALNAPGWRVLCAAAALCSLAATAATQLLKSNNLEERVFRGQSCRAKLEALEVGLSTGQIDQARATTAYMQCLEEAAYLESH